MSARRRTFLKSAAATVFAAVCTCAAAEADGSRLTFANPVDLQYRVRPEEGNNFREGADPDVVMWRDRYWLFASKCGGYYVSDDLVEWKLIPTADLPLEEYAPTAWVMNDRLHFSSRGGTVHRALDPDAGKWEKLKFRVPFTVDSMMFVDNGRLFDYFGGTTNKMPLWVQEMDMTTFKIVGKRRPITEMDDSRYGWDVRGHGNRLFGRLGCKEGAYMIKRGGLYYFQYATPGTEFHSYCDVALIGRSPLGPFTRQKINPISFKPYGYAKGAGHGCTFRDRHGNWWHVTTCVVSGVNRRIVMLPVFFDADGEMWCDTAFSDWPMVVPDRKTSDPADYRAGMMPLTYGKKVEVSSNPHLRKAIVDENMRSMWSAATGNAGEWAEVDLGGTAEIGAVQIGFGEAGDLSPWRAGDAARKWKLEVTEDGKTWKTVIDESGATDAHDHPYRAFRNPVRAAKIRVVCAGVPEGAKFELREIRAFGRMDVPLPSPPGSMTAVRDRTDRRRASLKWEASAGADGYIVRYGPARDKMCLSLLVRGGCEAELCSLDTELDYHWSVEAFNAAGMSAATPVRQ